MDYSDVLKSLISEIKKIKATGQTSINIDALEKYLDEQKNVATSGLSIEHQKLKQEMLLANLNADREYSFEIARAMNSHGKEALNALILINGGSLVALLGFLGATISKGLPASLGLDLTTSFWCFGIGVLTGALGFGMRYLTQYFYCSKLEKIAHWNNIFTILVAVMGFFMFGFGLYESHQGLLNVFTKLNYSPLTTN